MRTPEEICQAVLSTDPATWAMDTFQEEAIRLAVQEAVEEAKLIVCDGCRLRLPIDRPFMDHANGHYTIDKNGHTKVFYIECEADGLCDHFKKAGYGL
jgi:hypothetical protein